MKPLIKNKIDNRFYVFIKNKKRRDKERFMYTFDIIAKNYKDSFEG